MEEVVGELSSVDKCIEHGNMWRGMFGARSKVQTEEKSVKTDWRYEIDLI